jgi:hypothetical protein
MFEKGSEWMVWDNERAGEIVIVVPERLAFEVDEPKAGGKASGNGGAGAAVAAGLVTASDGAEKSEAVAWDAAN